MTTGPITRAQRTELHNAYNRAGITMRRWRRWHASRVLHRRLETASDMSADEAARLLAVLRRAIPVARHSGGDEL